jgi:hypothetical protein
MNLLFRSASSATTGGKWLKWLLPGGWVFTVVSGLLAAKSPKTGAGESDNTQTRLLNLLAKIAPPVFLAGVLLLVSWAVYAISLHPGGAPEYLSWAYPKENSATASIALTETHPDGSTSVFYQGALAIAEKPQVTWKFRGACVSSSCKDVVKPVAGIEYDWNVPPGSVALRLLCLMIITGVICGLLLGRLDANEFSMHLFYRNRLVRAFLGASNTRNRENSARGRIPSPFTGFAVDDDVPLQELTSFWPRAQSYKGDAKEWTEGSKDRYEGPYPIWGTALNLTTGEELSWQERKAASFIYSPLYCGWDFVTEHPQQLELPHRGRHFEATDTSDCAEALECLHAYRGTGKFYYEEGGHSQGSTSDAPRLVSRLPYTGLGPGPLIGTAMAASGAAISPNWGYHTSPAVAALLALFNIRIGWWTGNPRRRDSWKKYAPNASYLVRKELFGRADDASPYVYLSDGGHFENLGIYEMVRRRLPYIVACDADADPKYEFGDLANAVEKCRRDFGVEIEIDTSLIRPQKTTNLSQRHFAVGTINYPGANGKPAEKGILLYLKSSIIGNEPADVLGEANGQSHFPHDTTANQFFNETKFEAYRALGEHMFTGIWKEAADKAKHIEIKDELSDAEDKKQLELAATVVQFFKYLEKQYAGKTT